MKKLRQLWSSNAPWASSGYAIQMGELIPRIKKDYPVAMVDFFGLQGGIIEIDGVTHYPVINHVYGSDALVYHGNDFKADVCFSLQDIWVLNPADLQRVKRWIPVMPIDQDPIPPNVLDKLKYAYHIVTYSQYAQKELIRNGIYSDYIQHTVDTNIFKVQDKKKRKIDSKIHPDMFVVGMVGANKDNPPRKSFQEAMNAFKMFSQDNPKSVLYIHSNPKFPGGFEFDEYAKFLGIADKVIWPDAYMMSFKYTRKDMADIYSTFDVLLEPSQSEGFGVPIIEAQACGVPVIATKFTSMEELVKDGETGYHVEIAHKRWVPTQSYWAVPSVPSIYDGLIKVFRSNREDMAHKCRKFITENYDSDKVYTEKWLPLFERIEKEVYGSV